MTESPEPTNPPYPQQRTPEQHEAVRRRSLPLAACALVLGVLALILLAVKQVGPDHPPNILAVNLSFCAMLMGAGILFYAKGTKGTSLAVALALGGLLTGLAGPAIFARQTVIWRAGTEGRELQNVHVIADAARKYAAEHEGTYPPNLLVLLQENRIKPQDLVSPFGATQPLQDDVKALAAKFKEDEVLSTIEAHSDYTYVGGDLRLPSAATQPGAATQPAALSKEIIVAYAKSPVMRTNLAVAFADSAARFITLEEAEPTLKACNEARTKLGLPELRQPASVERALKEKEQK